MESLISIVEIPVDDFPRAVKFYQAVLGLSIQEVDMGGTRMGVLPGEGQAVNMVLVKGDGYKPSASGALVYLNAGNDLLPLLAKVERNGGRTIVGKTEISPEMGWFAHFLDSEGNRVGLHSAH